MPRKVFVAGEILTAADVNTNLMDQSVMVFDDATARATAIPAPVAGMVTYLVDTDSVEKFDGTNFVPVAPEPDPSGVLQIVRATDTTNRTNTSTTMIDANISVEITPLQATSNLLIVWAVNTFLQSDGSRGTFEIQITNSSNAGLSGGSLNVLKVRADNSNPQWQGMQTLIGFDPAVNTSARTYKGRFRCVQGSPITLQNADIAGQIYAIEVAG